MDLIRPIERPAETTLPASLEERAKALFKDLPPASGDDWRLGGSNCDRAGRGFSVPAGLSSG
jgi:hypothetical protein